MSGYSPSGMKIYPQMTQIGTDFSFLCVLCVSAVRYFLRSPS